MRACASDISSPMCLNLHPRVSAATELIATTSTAPDEHLHDLQRLLAVVGLRDERLVDVDTISFASSSPSHARS